MTTYLITGTSRGIGHEMARQLLARGDSVIGTVRREDQGADLREAGAQIELCDVADDGSVDAMAGRLNNRPIDVLVNNAGVYDPRLSFADLGDEGMRHNFEVNTLGPMRVTRALLANLRAGRAKHVFQLTSKMGSIADNGSGGAYAYRASKAALNAWSRSFALDHAQEGFVALVLHPGWVATDMGGAGAPVTPEQSVRGLLAVMDAASPERSGRFYGFDGEELPW